MTLKALVVENDLATTPPAEVKATLEAKNIQKTSAGQKIAASTIARKFGNRKMLQLAKRMEQADFALFVQMLVNGVDFAEAETQGAIDDLEAAGVLEAEEAAAFKSLGIWNVSPLEDVGLPDTVTEAEIEVAQAAIAKDVLTEKLQQDWSTLQNEGGINPAVAIGDRVALVVALRAAADDLGV